MKNTLLLIIISIISQPFHCFFVQGLTKKQIKMLPRGALGKSAAILGVCNAAGLGISLATGSHLHLDLIGTGAFTIAAVSTSSTSLSLRQRLSTWFVSIWATRLASFLFYRASLTGHDARLDNQLSTASGATTFWFISFLWGWITLLPHTLGSSVKKGSPFGPCGFIGSTFFGIGLAFEVIADFQKFFFKRKPQNKSSFCNSGLWQFSQHPNYFGNLLLWSGIWLLNTPGLSSSQLTASSISPIFLATLFFGQSTGTITNAVQLADAKYGHDPQWSLYKQNTPLLFPSPFALFRALFIPSSSSSTSRVKHK
mmetsp:Transcript_6985/g.9784  ORF Transcript_6985/g.9784 Transcript_6985/m.9784 type:complete len:311 (-) Transcript_6985:2715-3647(-)